MVAQVLGFEAFQVLMLLGLDPGPLFVDDVGQDGEFSARLHFMPGPVIGQFVAGFLPGHPLRDPLLAAAKPEPVFTRSIQAE